MEFFDSHAHYDDEQFDDDRDRLLSNMQEKNIGFIVNAGSNYESSIKSIELAKKYDFIYAAVGIHPHAASEGASIGSIEKLVNEDKVVAIGEIGLDYHYDFSPREKQLKIFEEQLTLSKKLDLPVIIHDREAHKDCMDLVKKFEGIRGVFHCYSGSVEMAKEIIRLGMYISFGGAITFKNAKKSLDVAKSLPIDKILIETDCPYLTPVPYRGKRNDSGYIVHTAKKLSNILDISLKELAKITYDNSRTLFGI